MDVDFRECSRNVNNSLNWIVGMILIIKVVLVVMLVMVMRQVPFTMNTESNGYYGTLMLGSEAGIYIIVGMICFILGVLITLITIKYRDKDTETVNSESQ